MESKMNMTAKISARIAALLAEGASTRDAIDSVLGGGTFDKLASDLYDALRAKG
jgi:hypothetical protein